MLRWVVSACSVCLVLGCGDAPEHPRTLTGAFSQIENSVQDMQDSVLRDDFAGELGDDRLGFAVVAFQESVAGTNLEADAKKLADKVFEVSSLAGRQPPLEELRAAVKELEDVVAEIKKKL